MNQSAFDPAAFLDATTTHADEKRPPLPEENPADLNGLYTALIGEIKTDSGIIGKGENAGKPWLAFLIPLQIEIPPQLQDTLKLRSTLTITDRAFADLTEDGRSLDESPGRNRQRRAYREATGTNVAGVPFAMRQLTGKVVKVKIKHEIFDRQDGSEPTISERIAAVLKA